MDKPEEKETPPSQLEKKSPFFRRLKSALQNKFYLIFLAVLIITSAALVLRTYQQQIQQKTTRATTTSTNPQKLVRRSKIPNIITKATTAKTIDVKTGKVVLAARIFSVDDRTIYLSLDLNKPDLNTRIDYIRYLNGRYIDHGSVKITKPSTQNLAFEWTINKPSGSRPEGKYKIATYTNGILEKRVNYTVTKNKISASSTEDPIALDLDYYLAPKLLSQAY